MGNSVDNLFKNDLFLYLASKACLGILFRELQRSQQNIHEKTIYRSTSKNG